LQFLNYIGTGRPQVVQVCFSAISRVEASGTVAGFVKAFTISESKEPEQQDSAIPVADSYKKLIIRALSEDKNWSFQKSREIFTYVCS
jgi:hypothetical protein